MCNPWKRTFTLAPLAPLTMFSSSSFLELHFVLGDYFDNNAIHGC
jgi:hypothetical protein